MGVIVFLLVGTSFSARCLDDGEYAEVQLGFLTNDRNEVGKQIFNVTGHDFYVHFSEDGVL